MKSIFEINFYLFLQKQKHFSLNVYMNCFLFFIKEHTYTNFNNIFTTNPVYYFLFIKIYREKS